MVSETEMLEKRLAQMKQKFSDNDQKMAHLVEVNEKQKICISDLEETLFQKQQQIQVMEESRGKAESDLTDVKENLNPRYLEVHELQLQLNAFQEQMTQALMTVEAERARSADFEKAYHDLESEFTKVSSVFCYYSI
jgi:chromosome segregation ATPase